MGPSYPLRLIGWHPPIPRLTESLSHNLTPTQLSQTKKRGERGKKKKNTYGPTGWVGILNMYTPNKKTWVQISTIKGVRILCATRKSLRQFLKRGGTHTMMMWILHRQFWPLSCHRIESSFHLMSDHPTNIWTVNHQARPLSWHIIFSSFYFTIEHQINIIILLYK